MNPRQTGRTLAGLLLGALAGAKLAYAAQFPSLLFEIDAAQVWSLAAGYSVPGSLLGAWGGLWFAARDRPSGTDIRLLAEGAEAGLPTQSGSSRDAGSAAVLADALTPALLAVLLILDAGAHFWSLSEPGHGAPARLWGLNFGDGVARHPVMWYDAACVALLLWTHRALGRWGGVSAGLRASVLWGAWFGASLLLAFLKPPFGSVLLVEKVHPRPALYPPGFTAEQWLCAAAAAGLAWCSVLALRTAWRRPREA